MCIRDRNIIINDFIENEDISAREKINLLNDEEKNIRNQAKLIIENAAKERNIKIESNDKDYVFINFILENLPKGLVGLLLAVILSAAMSSTSSEINALATTTSIDIIKRNFKTVNDENIVFYTKLFTLFWGICSIGVACVAFLADNLIQLVNIIGSIFYGNVLGIFLIAFFMKKIKDESGVALTASTMFIFVVLSIMAFYLARFSILSSEAAGHYLQNVRARNLVQTGLEIGLQTVSTSYSSLQSSITGKLNKGTYTVSVDNSKDEVNSNLAYNHYSLLKSTTVVGGVHRAGRLIISPYPNAFNLSLFSDNSFICS